MSRRWTDEQVAAITSTGHTMLEASAGTGKTTTIVGKILWSLGLDVGPARPGVSIPSPSVPLGLDGIAAVTFTEKAAHDLAAKLREAIEAADPTGRLARDLQRAVIGTIHGFAADLLREHALRLGIDPSFRILEPRETDIHQREVIRETLATALRERDEGAIALTRRYGLEGWAVAPGAVERIRGVMRDLRWRARELEAWSEPVEESRYTRRLDRDALRARARFAGAWSDDPEDVEREEANLELTDALYRLGRASVGGWLAWLENENARDFDSLILDARRLVSRPETAGARAALRRRFRLVVIDEFQDTDRAQWEIARSLAGLDPDEPAAGPQLFLVGDPKQSIYRFRGADIDVWNEARATLQSEGRTLELSHNFRSEPRVVGLVNRVGKRALDDAADELMTMRPESVVRYRALRPARAPSGAAGLEWLVVDAAGRAAANREQEARRVASRLDVLIGRAAVVDPDDGTLRTCRAGDVAILGRRNEDLATLEPALRNYGLPFHNAASRGLADRQEVLDMVTALRAIDDPFDDLRGFAFLRAPFVGLRDEILARIGLHRRGSHEGTAPPEPFLDRAAAYLRAVEAGEADWYDAPESAHVSPIEREALRRGLDALGRARGLADRADHARVLEEVLDRTGYRLHLLIRGDATEALANVDRFLALLEEYGHLTLGGFLHLWDRWGEQDPGIPQARLYATDDDVVTLSTIHGAKGLEWPIVVLVGTDAPLVASRRLVGAHWVDPDLGPILLPKRSERGPRAELALERRIVQDRAEEARLLYVATTRARDRLLVAAPEDDRRDSFAGWLSGELASALELHQVLAPDENGGAASETVRAIRATAEHASTGTGGQLDAFEDAGRGQLDLFARARDGGPETAPEDRGFVVIRRGGAARQTSFGPPPMRLDWLDGIEPAGEPARPEEVRIASWRPVTSATERRLRADDREAWERRYLHAVLEAADYLPDPTAGEPLPGRVRGTLIHGVLERIREEEELARILEETMAALDLGELESSLASGAPYREALEREIAAVIRSPEWGWYVEGEHHRELAFLHRAPEGWTVGAFDLYLPERALPGPQASLFENPDDRARGAWVIDFKTHRVEADDIERVAARYAVQVDIYRAAASALGAPSADGDPPRVALHFTHPNRALEL